MTQNHYCDALRLFYNGEIFYCFDLSQLKRKLCLSIKNVLPNDVELTKGFPVTCVFKQDAFLTKKLGSLQIACTKIKKLSIKNRASLMQRGSVFLGAR